ncbi:type IV secretion protein Rhs [Streptomyces sp. NRRL B-1677]|uniref:putative T7SS-secreted protein n=1 Tax=Streptomyces sp. NRRL B-1677 TaxID=2682966 RepID=UPI001892916D|nr:polymorphic toxin type 30 domain-containing protein [Streptomyces sp. NRRL B-1677]MBF6044376.1 type IV secretion protein Rhs [Streptomyces sp. NRRL B-1677]
MGLWDPVDAIGELAEKGVHKVEKKAGEAVEWGAGKAAKALDKIGAHDEALAVKYLGDRTASDLGAEIKEEQLGRTENPLALIHGEPWGIEAAAKHLHAFHKAFNTAHSGLQRVRSGEWKGEGAKGFDTHFAPEPKKWAQAADACDNAAKALSSYAHTVRWAQKQALEAIRLYKQGTKATKKAADAYNDKVDAYNAKVKEGKDPGERPGEFHDPGAADVKEAHRILNEARKQRNTAAGEAKAKIDKAVEAAPKEPAFHTRMKGDAQDFAQGAQVELLHFGGGVFRAGTDLVKFGRSMNPLDPYNVTHPAEYLNGVSNTAAGLVSLASHPERIPGALLGPGWGSDPSEAGGRLLGNFLLSLPSGGAAGAGARFGAGAAREGAEIGAQSAARAGAKAGSKAGSKAGEEGAEGAARQGTKQHPHEPNTDPGKVEVCETDPVDIATGRMFLPQTDVTLPGALPLVFSRHLKSGYSCGRWFGPSWASTVDQRLEIDDEGVIFVDEHGRLLEYPHPVPGVPTMPAKGPRWPLAIERDGTYAVTEPGTGLTRHFAPQEDGREALLHQLTDRNGHWITYEYDADGTPNALAHSGGYRLRVTTDTEAGRITALHLADDTELIRYGYDEAGRLTEVFNSSGQQLRFGYDERGRMTSWTDRNGTHYAYTYDDEDRCVFQSGTEGHMRSSLAYGEPDPDTGLRVTKVTNSLGHTTAFTINRRSQIIARTDPDGATTLSTWDRHDRLLSSTDPLGARTEFRYDAEGRLTEVFRPDGRRLSATYNDLGLPETTVGSDGASWRYGYDESGNRTSAVDPSGAETLYGHDALGHPATVTDALGGITRITCNGAGLPVEITDPLGAVTSYRRDSFGRVTTVIDPLGSTTRLTWTVEGRLARRIAADGAEEQWSYDGEGNCTTYTDALGGVTRYEYGPFDLLTARTGPDGVRHEFTHNTRLQLTRVTNPQGLTWDYTYDPVGRPVAETDFDGRTLTYAHDAAGRLVSRTNGLGETIAYEHDVLGRVVRKDAAGAETTYVHDAAGRLVEASGPGASVVYSRDRLGRVKSETTNGRTLTFAYDALGRRTRRVTPGGAVSTWAYDAAGRRTSLTASGQVFDVEHDAVGREVARRFGQGLTLSSAWDAVGRLVSQGLEGAGEELLQHRAYTYRRDGHLTGITDVTHGSRAFDLDAAGRVTAVSASGWQERYVYDEAGNQTEATWPANHPGAEARGARTYTGTRIARAGGIRYEHDAQGRVVVRQKARLSRKPDTWRYEWDAEDRLTAVVTPDGTRWRYTYDPMGRRIAKERLTESGGVAERVDFTWDGATLTEQTSWSTSLPNPITLTWDHNGLHPIAQTERISAAEAPQREMDRRFFAIVTDLVGTPTELVDETGRTAWRTRSTLWGTTAWSRDSTTYTPLRFPGQYFDPETGLHYNYHRHYDPESARYTSPDPLGLTPAPNPATYVHNPHTWADPLGLSGCPQGEAGSPKPKGFDSPAGPGPWNMTGRDPMSVVPDHASIRELTPDPNGGAQYGLEYKWVDSDGRTVRLRIHGPDGNAPAGSNAASGDSYRIQFGGKYQDDLGNLYPRNVHNEKSPHYDPDAANATHIPWPNEHPGL